MRRRSGKDGAGPPPDAIVSREAIRGIVYQIVLVLTLAWLGYVATRNAQANLGTIASGFGFLRNTAGFGVNLSLIPYSESDTYGRVFVVDRKSVV